MSAVDRIGWDRLRHGGLLLDPARLRQVEEHVPAPLSPYLERELRRRAGLLPDGAASAANAPDFVAFVLQEVCGFDHRTGVWQRGPQVPAEWSRQGIAGEAIKPRMLWTGATGGVLPVFLDAEARIGVGRGRRAASQVLQWLRAGEERLALLTNGRQWRLVFAGLDFDAWCEWDVDLWFEEGAVSAQVTALRTLLAPPLWSSAGPDAASEGGLRSPPPLLQAVLDSRKGQAELSAVLGERVREAVELLLQAHGEILKERCGDVDAAEIYRAAVRVVMRMVVVLFAEARELLPRENALYHGAYGLGGLLEELEKIAARGGNRLGRSWNAWPRVLALFRLVYEGSHHRELLVPRYGGELFAPAGEDPADGLSRALAVFESACFERELMPDRDVHRILERITRTRVRVRQGRGSTRVRVPVDFSDLSSEYIGILYEGLLDFELKTAPAGDPIIFLAVGNQPALPLSRLEAMDDRAIANLLEKLKDTSAKADGDEEGEDETADADDDVASGAPDEIEAFADEDDGDDDADAESDDAADADDARHATRTRAETWARRAVEVGKLVRRPAGTLTPEKRRAHEHAIGAKARQLVTRVVLPGEWYLVRWGGTRKGSGTFYTRPALAVPTVQRTLRPLAYDPPLDEEGRADLLAPAARWTPKKPEEILALTVCDPACGSGTFPVAALRFLTDALYVSLHHHGRVPKEGDRAIERILEGLSPKGDVPEERLGHELLPCPPDSELFEPRLKAVLRRYVVERCIYGVDLDPLAVELCRLALWIETMDRMLPFSFLDHKIKCGNALVGAWFDRFQHYPVMAWKNREGGDKGHGNGVHFEKNARGKAIKAFVKDVLTPDLRSLLTGQLELLRENVGAHAGKIHDDALATLSRLHDLPVQDAAERARIYREELLASPAYQSLRAAMDRWCACWFWPADALEHAPLPGTLATPGEETDRIARRIASRKRFFHWELEFPDVFREAGAGFDAVVGNPPWDIAKPNSKEYFSGIDPLYRSYGKQEALDHQTRYFVDADVERNWLDYNADFRAQSNYVSYAASPFGDPNENEKSQDRFSIARGKENQALHTRWRAARAKSRGFADAAHPFRHQGSADLNLYKLFLEQAHALLGDGGRLGFIVPSGLYSDHGTGALRRLFLERCRWEWLFGFENRDKVFDIDSRFKFNPIVVEKGGATEAIHTAFMRRRLEDWERAETLATPYALAQVERFSPRSRAILEIQSPRDLEILEKIYANTVLLGDDGSDGWGITYAREFDMTNDSKLFPPRPKWEAQGYRPDEYSRWLKGDWRPIGELWAELGERSLAEGERRCAQPPYDRLPIPRADIPEGIILSREADSWIREERIEDTALPLYEGRMIGQFDFSQKGWVRGKGRGAVWREIPWDRKQIEPQFLMGAETFRDHLYERHLRRIRELHGVAAAEEEALALGDPDHFAEWWVSQSRRCGYMDVTSATNTRTIIASHIPFMPCGNKVPVLASEHDMLLPGVLSSFTVDFEARRRMSGLSLNYFILSEIGLPPLGWSPSLLGTTVLALMACDRLFAVQWLRAMESGASTWRRMWAVTPFERLRREAVLNAVCFALFDVAIADARDMLVSGSLGSSVQGFDTWDVKGFWRVDKEKDPELRRTILSLVAFHDLYEKIRACGGNRHRGIETFLEQNEGEGWMLPETLCLAEYGLGRGDRAKHPQPVASRLGPRFYDWQLAQAPDESWRECRLHARNLLGEEGYRHFLDEIEQGVAGSYASQSKSLADHQPAGVRESRAQYGLFG